MWDFIKFEQNTAIIDEYGGRTMYRELQAAGKALLACVNRRCLVFNLCKNEKGSLLGYTAFLNGGGSERNAVVPLMLDAALDREMLAALTENYKPDYFWLPHDMITEFPDFDHIFDCWGYSLLKTPYNNEYPLHDDLALLLTTSGSTGSPKLVRQTYANIRANTESIVEYLQLDVTERPVTTMPMSYTYGLSIINSHLWVGASIILTNKTLMQREFWQQVKEFEATSFGGVPYIYEMLEKLRFFRMELPSLGTMTQAGGKLSPELHRKFAEYAMDNNKKFIVMYGQTEATARMSYLPHEKSLEKYGSMGIAIPGGSFSLIDVEGNIITEPEITGELVYKGANVTPGYAEHGGDLIKGDENGSVLITGDMAKRDTDGYYYIVGRKKRFLKIYGSRVNLDETERMLAAAFSGHENSFECACGGIDDKMSVYITRKGMADKVLKFLTEKTGINHAAFDIAVINEIPRNDAGKILYSELSNVSGGSDNG